MFQAHSFCRNTKQGMKNKNEKTQQHSYVFSLSNLFLCFYCMKKELLFQSLVVANKSLPVFISQRNEMFGHF